jgi:chitin synthase
MQGLGFSLPLVLATPVTFIVFLVSSLKTQFAHVTIFQGVMANFFYWEGFDAKKAMVSIVIGFFVYWASQLWVASHVWFPKLERLAKNERIFTKPTYESTIIDQCMMMNRRRLDEITPEAGLILFLLNFNACRVGPKFRSFSFSLRLYSLA